MSDLEQQPEKKAISRRTVTKAMAWSVPAIAIAAPVPAMAASGGGGEILPGRAFKWSGQSCAGTPGVPGGLDQNFAYMFGFRIENTSAKTIYIYSWTLTTSSSVTFATAGAFPAVGTAISAGDYVDFNVWANSNNSGNLQNILTTVSVDWGHTWPTIDTDPHPDDPMVQQWTIPSTPTLPSAGYAQCTVVGYVPL